MGDHPRLPERAQRNNHWAFTRQAEGDAPPRWGTQWQKKEVRVFPEGATDRDRSQHPKLGEAGNDGSLPRFSGRNQPC